MKTMSLKGGLNQYILSREESRYVSQESPYGRKVKFLNKNGYDSEQKSAREYFKEGQILTVKEIYVGRSSSQVELLEVPNKLFNTVMFGDVE